MQMQYPSIMICYLLFSCNSSDTYVINYIFQAFSALCSTYIATPGTLYSHSFMLLWILHLKNKQTNKKNSARITLSLKTF